MNCLIVYAHPDPNSFNAALRDAAAEVLRGQGHSVEISDLYAMNFKPVVDRNDFLTCHDTTRFNVSLEQRYAHKNGGLVSDIASELERLERADLLILQFPLWWFSMPAILKGWIDRVFVSGVAYGRSAMFERGKFVGKRAMVCLTTGAPIEAFGPDSLNGEILSLLAPLHRGVLAFTGMQVLQPFVAYHVPYAGPEGRASMLAEYRKHLFALDSIAALPAPHVADHPGLFKSGVRPMAQ
jgi:NAD(P)H dehydrogenase (quinone)